MGEGSLCRRRERSDSKIGLTMVMRDQGRIGWFKSVLRVHVYAMVEDGLGDLCDESKRKNGGMVGDEDKVRMRVSKVIRKELCSTCEEQNVRYGQESKSKRHYKVPVRSKSKMIRRIQRRRMQPLSKLHTDTLQKKT